ncbi:MAG TPA: hypothetical protein VKZ50_08290 [bacterium]|nr:hypothetical protein [bacterium]
MRYQDEISAFYLHGSGLHADDRAQSGPEAVPVRRIRHEVASRLETLPLRHRLPLLLVDFEGFSCDTAARILSIPRWVLGARLAKARWAFSYLKPFRTRAA